MSRRHLVLVIEDNEINREILEEILKEDYNLLFAENGKIGMELLHEHTSDIDLVLLDIMMPVMDGYQVLEAVRKDSVLKEIPIVVTTGRSHTEDEVRCLQMGASDFVVKPYNPFVVRLRVERIIRLRESMMSNLQKSIFLQNMRHEVRTPLNAIMGFSQILCMPEGTISAADRENYANYIMNNSMMLTRMIDDVLTMSDLESGELQVNCQDVSINGICRDALKTTEFSYPAGVKVYFTTEVDDAFTIHTDGSRIQQALVNFITNACKFTSEGEIHIHCSISEVEGYVAISVADTGSGIPADKAEEIFDRFVKLDNFKPGSGLGLSIIRNIAKQLNGKTYLDTSYTDGARFILALPCEKI